MHIVIRRFGLTVVSYTHTYVHTLMKNFTVALKGKSCVMYVIQHMPRRKRGTHE